MKWSPFALAFARALHDERYECGIYTSGDMARRIDIPSVDTYRQVETGRRPLTEEKIPKVAKVLGEVCPERFKKVQSVSYTLDRLVRKSGIQDVRAYVRDVFHADHDLGVLLYSLLPLTDRNPTRRGEGIRMIEESGAAAAVRAYWKKD